MNPPNAPSKTRTSPARIRKSPTRTRKEVENLSEEDAFRNLANAIVVQAVKDWRRLCKKGEPSDKFTRLRQFFKSEWCSMLCGNIDPLYILEALERERKATLNEI